jgi:basic membrane protein A and related proteins
MSATKRMTKQLFFLLVILLLALGACAAPAAPAPAPAAPATEATPAPAAEATPAPAEEAAAPAVGAVDPSELRIGLITDVGRVNDRSFNQSAWEGVLQAAEAFGLPEASYRYIETQAATEYADNILQFVEAGFPVIVTVGFALGEATRSAALENPDIYFIGVDQFQGEPLPNVVGLVFNEDRSGFLAGALAAHLTESGTIAAVLGTDLVPPVVAFKEGYEAGARYINPDINVISTYHPGELSQAFTDPEWGANTARQAIDQGADVIFGAGGLTGNGALQEVATQEGLYCIGVDTDQWLTLPAAHPCLVSSAMKLITPSVVELITNVTTGEFQGGNYFGGAGLAPFHDFEDEIPQEVKDELEEIAAGLEDGSIDTGYNP